MPNVIRFLLLEDNPVDADKIGDALREAGLTCVINRVDNRDAFVHGMEEFRPDIVLADVMLPGFDGRAALKIVRGSYPMVPVVLVSGALGDDEAVELIKAGARDYVLKDKLARLGPAVTRALFEERGIRERKAAERALHASEIRYRRLFETAKDGILIIDRRTGMLIDINPFLVQMLGYPLNSYLGKKLWETEAFAGLDAGRRAFDALQKQDYLRYDDLVLNTFDGNTIEVEFIATVYDVGHHQIIQCNIRDISVRKHAERDVLALQAQLRVQAILDPLTGLYNRRYLEESLSRELILAERQGHPVGIVMGDLDHFKNINDQFGHQAGDEVLRTFGALMRRYSRGSDIFCRYGGEEFLLVFPGMSEAKTLERAEQLRAEIAATPISFGALTMRITASFGVAAYPVHGSTADALIAAADSAMFTAKRAGRNQVCGAPASPTQVAHQAGAVGAVGAVGV